MILLVFHRLNPVPTSKSVHRNAEATAPPKTLNCTDARKIPRPAEMRRVFGMTFAWEDRVRLRNTAENYAELRLAGESSCCHFAATLSSSAKTRSMSFMRLVMP